VFYLSIINVVLILFTVQSLKGQVNEDFESGVAVGWTTSGSASTGTFVVADPSFQSASGVITQPNDDHTPIPGVNAYFTATNSSVGNADVDGGTSTTTSPVYNIGPASQLSIWYFFGQRDNGGDSGDFFRLEYSLNGGATYTTLVFIGDIQTNAIWTQATAPIPPGSSVRVRVSAADGPGGGDIIEGGIDDLTITPSGPAITIEDISLDEDAGAMTFTATHSGFNVGAAFTVDYATSDITANSGSDYTSSFGTLNFNGTVGDTETISVPITDDFILEGNETYSIQFSNTSDPAVNISDGAVGTIVDNENDPNIPRPYEERDAMNLRGNFKMKGNTNLRCVSGCPATPTTNNPSVNMGYADIDADPITINSSSSNVTLPAGATVEWAGLYWGGMYNSTRGGISNPPASLNIDQVKLREPGSASYTTINAQVRNIETGSQTNWRSFMAHADVTSIVQSGGNGNYFVADIALATGSAFTGPYGGWTIIVIYTDSTEKTRRISIWDGFDFFGFGANDNFTVTGLLTPGNGGFETHAGYFGFDGEASSTGDFISINGTALSNALNPNNNTLNGTISEFGLDVGGRNPNFGYNWGIDADIFDASGTVPNGATDLDVVLGSSSEGIWGGVFVVSNEIAFPTVSSKVFTPNAISLGDESTVTLNVDNPPGGVLLTNFSLTDNLPSGMTISATPNATSSCGGFITANAGSSAFSISGLIIPAGSSCTLNFDVVTDDLGMYINTISPADVSNNQNIPLQGETSSTLTVNVKSVITNRRITYRIKKD